MTKLDPLDKIAAVSEAAGVPMPREIGDIWDWATALSRGLQKIAEQGRVIRVEQARKAARERYAFRKKLGLLPDRSKATMDAKAEEECIARRDAQAWADEEPESCYCSTCGHPPCSWCEGAGHHPERDEEETA